jgi:hypothetical protein
MGPPVTQQINADATTSGRISTTATNIVAPESTKGYRRRGPKIIAKERKRQADLEADPLAIVVTPTSVLCGRCNNWISLDGRGRFYPDLWIKHRGKCDGKERKKRVARTQVIVCFGPSRT